MRMTSLTVFVRTLMKTSAIFIGVTAVMLHPTLQWTSASRGVTAQQSPAEGALDALIAALKDTDAGVRRQVASTLGELGNRRAVPALVAALKDTDVDVRAHVVEALGELGDVAAVDGLIGAARDANADIRR